MTHFVHFLNIALILTMVILPNGEVVDVLPDPSTENNPNPHVIIVDEDGNSGIGIVLEDPANDLP